MTRGRFGGHVPLLPPLGPALQDISKDCKQFYSNHPSIQNILTILILAVFLYTSS